MRNPDVTVVDGIEVHVTRETLDDFEITEAIADTQDPSATDDERTVAVVRLFRLIYGGDYARVKAELREANGGRLTNETMLSFLTATMGAVGAKN